MHRCVCVCFVGFRLRVRLTAQGDPTTAPTDWAQLMQVNLLTPMLLSQRVAPGMKRKGAGCIINIGSESGVTTQSMVPVYAASKHGMYHRLPRTKTHNMQAQPQLHFPVPTCPSLLHSCRRRCSCEAHQLDNERAPKIQNCVGLRGWSYNCHNELRKHGVRVVCINPDWVNTPMIQAVPGTSDCMHGVLHTTTNQRHRRISHVNHTISSTH